jgi:GNAT superfamily N-acetyltransferase
MEVVFRETEPPAAATSPALRAAYAAYLTRIADLRAHLDGADLLIAREDAALLGAVLLVHPGARAEYTGDASAAWPATWATLRQLAVAPAARRRGVGRALTVACIDRARALGATHLALHTTANLAAARALYRDLKWKRAPAHDLVPTPGLFAEAYSLAL